MEAIAQPTDTTTPILATAGALRSLLDSLGHCADCDEPATRADNSGVSYCDHHGGSIAAELPYAAIVRGAMLRTEGLA